MLRRLAILAVISLPGGLAAFIIVGCLVWLIRRLFHSRNRVVVTGGRK